MKDTPARVSQRFLLVVSIIFAGASAPSMAQSPAAARGPARAARAAKPLTDITRASFTQGAAQAAEVEELSKNGPAIPAAFNMSNFRFRALFKWSWSVQFVYELSQPGSVTLTVSVDGHPHPVALTVKGLVAGIHRLSADLNHECSIPLPGGIGAATYSINAVTTQPSAPGVVPFFVRLITAGPQGMRAPAPPPDGAVVTPPEGFTLPLGARLTDAAYGYPTPSYQAAAMGIKLLSFTPSDIRVVEGQPSANAAYSFRAKIPFNHAEARVLRVSDDGAAEVVSSRMFDEGLEAGETVKGTWDCMRNGSPSLGRHMLAVRAWFTSQNHGPWVYAALKDQQVYVRP